MKNKIRLVLILAFLAFISFYYGGDIKQRILYINDEIVEQFYNSSDFLKESINEHFNQAEEIRFLRSKNQELEKSSALLASFANRLNLLLEDKNSTRYLPNVKLVKAISYVEIGDYKKVWLDLDEFKGENKGLIYQGYTAGMVVAKNNRPMALLQGDEKCVFSVYIGQKQTPGLVQGKNGELWIRYIPKSDTIELDDEVFTSGLDNIFFAGVPVGKVVKIVDEDLYKSALVESFVNPNLPSYFYMIENF